jgi:hypothetical protein
LQAPSSASRDLKNKMGGVKTKLAVAN